jgi:hypothetical protein
MWSPALKNEEIYSFLFLDSKMLLYNYCMAASLIAQGHLKSPSLTDKNQELRTVAFANLLRTLS